MPRFNCLRPLLHAYEATQVELHGRYSLPRLRELLRFSRQSTVFRNAAILLLTPLPGLALLIFTDALPLNPPHTGIYNQTIGLYLRSFLCGFVMAGMIAMQIHQSSPSLPLSTVRLGCISVFVGLVTPIGLFVAGVALGFPTPFVSQLLTPPWFISFSCCLWMSWKAALRSDREARVNVVRYSQVFLAQCSIIVVYTAYGIVFSHVNGDVQSVLSLALPLLKVMFKNWVHRGVYHMEDLAPSVIVFNIDVFHAMFVAAVMQKAQKIGTVIVVMAMDLFNACVALFEIHMIIRRVNRLSDSCQDAGRRTSSSITSSWVDKIKPRRSSNVKLCAVDYALRLINTEPHIRDNADLLNARHLRDGHLWSPFQEKASIDNSGSFSRVGTRDMLLRTRTNSIIPSEFILPAVFTMPGAPGDERNDTENTDHAQSTRRQGAHFARAEQMQLECVKSVLKMMHMIEFYVLIEFVEVTIAGIYTIYTWVLAFLPNHEYYNHLAGKPHHEIMVMVTRLAVYTSLELLSFLIFCSIVDRSLRYMSCTQILAFVLQKHMRMVQTTLSMWVFFVVQLAFEHFGTDYTFRFNWLRAKNS